ncbi:hypothetical protein BTA51_05335 [Hahella sp. CCB-MM4]|uniref:hypothetical protein n=1 Tax=Hahella sp. (strain CCB-MM4) TaxID=1926491 RepID=UPI000B9C032F|nr:hypothetical protein [Hahella sp. CCB-MM4]OZG74433.1 hypothetical protein BTA51_05335 [Hahella sp. CCB-MM4]
MKGILALPLLLIALYSSSSLAWDNIQMPTEEGCGDIHMEIMGVCVWKPYVATRSISDLQREIRTFKASVAVAENSTQSTDDKKAQN